LGGVANWYAMVGGKYAIWKISRRPLKFFEVILDKILPPVQFFLRKKKMVIYRVYLVPCEIISFACANDTSDLIAMF
jgi:hypothetical protein